MALGGALSLGRAGSWESFKTGIPNPPVGTLAANVAAGLIIGAQDGT